GDRFFGPGPWQNTARVCRIHGHLNLDAFRDAVLQVFQRHELLRTRFYLEGGTLRAKISSTVSDVLKIDEFPDPGSSSETTLESAIYAEVNRRFLLEQDFLLRVRLLRVRDGTSVLILNTHHIVSDIKTVAIIEDEVAEYYSALVEGRAHRL